MQCLCEMPKKIYIFANWYEFDEAYCKNYAEMYFNTAIEHMIEIASNAGEFCGKEI